MRTQGTVLCVLREKPYSCRVNTVREDKSSAFLGLARASVVEKINTQNRPLCSTCVLSLCSCPTFHHILKDFSGILHSRQDNRTIHWIWECTPFGIPLLDTHDHQGYRIPHHSHRQLFFSRFQKIPYYYCD